MLNFGQSHARCSMEFPMATDLKGKKIAILATIGFEQAELIEPRKALEQAGAKTDVVSLNAGKIKAWNEKDWGMEVDVDLTVDQANAADYDALLLPGGVMNPDKLRINETAVNFVKEFVAASK